VYGIINGKRVGGILIQFTDNDKGNGKKPVKKMVCEGKPALTHQIWNLIT
jgi:hypothetical protein